MSGNTDLSNSLTVLRRAHRMRQMIDMLQRVASRLGMRETALTLDLALAGAEVDIERMLESEAKRRLSA